MIFIFLFSYSYSFGVFTDITRPYGIIIFLSVIYGLFIISLIYFFVVYYKEDIASEKEGCEKFLYFIFIFFIVLPILPIFLTVALALGAYVDWSLDFKNENFSDDVLYAGTFISTPLRLGISILFFVIYI